MTQHATSGSFWTRYEQECREKLATGTSRKAGRCKVKGCNEPARLGMATRGRQPTYCAFHAAARVKVREQMESIGS